MQTFRSLGYRYLWVDRLCIIQDGSWDHKYVQLEQMAIIYGQADLTIVAAEGDSAEFGLFGVSHRRHAPDAIRINDSLGLGGEVPSLHSHLQETVYADRGWTYQQYVVSPRLLIFTKFGLYFRMRQGLIIYVFAEGPMGRSVYTPSEDDTIFGLLKEYKKKSLTHRSDALHAITGILYLLCGNETSSGIPWQ